MKNKQQLINNSQNSISIICPTFNEEKYIGKILSFYTSLSFSDKELIIIDGGSTDKTRDLVLEWSNLDKSIKLLDNDKKYVPFALNKAIKECKNQFIARIDAHCEYSNDYFEKIIETFNCTDADIVGGPTRVKSNTIFQKVAGMAICSPFGIGDSKVHNQNFKGYVDHVTFGAWKRSIFDDIGYFDERLIRNQDDEFHYRAKSMGKKIFLNPDIKLWYFPRKNIVGLFKQYFQYGFFKPLVIKKVRTELKIRHLIPSLFFIYCLGFILGWDYLYAFPLFSYLSLNIYFTIKLKKSFIDSAMLLFVFPTIHLAYGMGFLFGIYKTFVP